MKKNIYSLSFGLMLCASLSAQDAITEFPYSANWQYKSDVTSYISNPEKIDTTQYDLGGWSTIAVSGNRPFYIPISSGNPVSNTMEFFESTSISDTQESYLISPAFDFSNAGYAQTISLKCGKQANGLNYRIDLVYSTNYAGSPSEAEWVTIAENLVPSDQSGLGTSKFATVTATANIVSPNAVLAIRSVKVSDESSTNTKIRLTGFNVSLTEKEVVETLPYAASWSFKEGLANPADSIFYDQSIDTSDQSNWYLGGWTSVVEAKTKYFAPLSNSVTIDGTKYFRQVPNTIEWTDGCKSSNTKDAIAWLISPKIDLSGDDTKYVKCLVGKELADQLYSNLSLYYATDYAGDYSTATWNVLQEGLVPADQASLDPASMTVINIPLELNAATVTFAIKGAPQADGTVGSKQTKLRVKDFTVSTESSVTAIETVTAATNDALAIYPNPTTDVITLASAKEIAAVDVYNISGQAVMHRAGNASQLSVAQLPGGFYQVVVRFADGTKAAQRLIKQ